MQRYPIRNVSSTVSCIALCLACGLVGWSDATPLPVETFFQKPQYGGAVLSPTGKFLAVIVTANGRRNIGVLDLDQSKVDLVTGFDSADVIRLVWQSDERMVAVVGDLQQGTGDPPRIFGIVAFNRDGKDVRPFSRSFERPWSLSLVREVTGTNEVILSALERTVKSRDLYRFDTVTGRKTLLTYESPGNASKWVLDYDSAPRAVVTADLDHDTSAWYVRKSATDPWQKVEQAPFGRLQSDPIAFSPDGTVIYISSRRKNDRLAVYEYQIESGQWKGPIAEHDDRDLDPTFIGNVAQRKLFGFRYVSDTPSQVWFDGEWARMQKSVDMALPDTVNGLQHAGDRWIIVSYSDRNPGEVSLLDAKTLKLQKLFSYRPWINPGDSAATKWIRYQARDGLTIPAMLTLPHGSSGRPVPLVVDIHGGPNVAATAWGYQRDPQFFASRGYATIQPQFRGTEGFGFRFLSAGYRKWGDQMQDDLEDAVKWAVAEGIANPDRVCFYGASYGGYAAMWGAIKNAKIIKCAVAFVGVSSIDYLFDNAQTDVSQLAEKSTLMVEQIGDPKTERARFKRVSPLDNADQVGVPILLAYGALDVRVPLAHGNDFRAALDKYHKPYEWLLYDHEGHGFNREENVFDFYNHVEQFLAKYLGPGTTAPKRSDAKSD
jgi:dipeptidyl aminopeptidase/acylaminoacyl peptidase